MELMVDALQRGFRLTIGPIVDHPLLLVHDHVYAALFARRDAMGDETEYSIAPSIGAAIQMAYSRAAVLMLESSVSSQEPAGDALVFSEGSVSHSPAVDMNTPAASCDEEPCNFEREALSS